MRISADLRVARILLQCFQQYLVLGTNTFLSSFSWSWIFVFSSWTKSGAEIVTLREPFPLFWIKSEKSGDSGDQTKINPKISMSKPETKKISKIVSL